MSEFVRNKLIEYFLPKTQPVGKTVQLIYAEGT